MRIFAITMAPVSPPYDDGPKNMVMGIAQRSKSHEFYFVSALGKDFPKNDNINFIRSPFQGTGRHQMSFLQKLFISIIIYFKMKKVDIFQFFFTPQMYFSAAFKRLLKRHNKKSIQVVSSVHTLFARNSKDAIPSLFFSDYVVVHSEYAKKVLIETGIKNVMRIYPGVELNRFNPSASDSESLKLKKEANRELNIVYPGTYKILEESYSLEDFCKVALNVAEKSRNVRFIMACRIRTKQDGVLKRRFNALIRQYKLEGSFSLLDTVKDIPALFSSSTIGVMPAKRDMIGILEIPLVLLEMAAMEKPVVYGAVPPLGELYDKGVGVKVEDASARGYADAILKLLADSDYASQISRRSREAVHNHFNMDRTAGEYRKLYESLGESI